ncbi:MAG TPA: hydrolase [Fodinibius sp.]|nr:hydrolase [Fodinibius sp.]
MLNKDQTLLVLVDVQGKLAEIVHESGQVLANMAKLIQGLQLLEVPVIWLEQYPEGLGDTSEQLKKYLDNQEPIRKMTFSACRSPEFTNALEAAGRTQVLVAGIETHVCVYQTAAMLKERDYEVEVVADAVSSRTRQNKEIGLAKMQHLGIAPTSVEMVLYELMEAAGTETFKKMLKIIK